MEERRYSCCYQRPLFYYYYFITTHYYFITTHYYFITTHYYFITTHYYFVTTHYYFISTHYYFITTHYYFITTHYYFITTHYYFITTHYYFISTHYYFISTQLAIGFCDSSLVTVWCYLAEIWPKNKLHYFSFIILFEFLSTLYVAVIGKMVLRYLTWPWLIVAGEVIPTLLYSLLICGMPESPRSLFVLGNIKEDDAVLSCIAKFSSKVFDQFFTLFALKRYFCQS